MFSVEKYYKPESIEEAANLLNKIDDSQLIAGGTDFIPGYHISSKRFSSGKLIDISNIKELKTISEENHIISIGSCSTFSSLLKNEIIITQLPVLAEAVLKIGSAQIRNRATIGGNISNNAPCADSIPPLLVYDANVELYSLEEKIVLPLNEFLMGAYSTKISTDQILTRVIIDKSKLNYDSGFFYKLGRRRAVAVSRLTFAFLFKKNNDVLENFAAAVGAVTPIGKRFYDVEKEFENMKITDAAIKKLTEVLVDKVLLYSGLRWSSLYKIPVLAENIYYNLHKHLM